MWVHRESNGSIQRLGRLLLLPDTHAHLDATAFDVDREDVLERARSAGVDRILAVGSDLATSRIAVQLARTHDFVYAAVGIHPHEVERFADEATKVHSLLDEEKVVAVGEIGLDYYRGGGGSEADQMEAFRAQVGWAVSRGLPVTVHNREADADVLNVLVELGVRPILHCFSGSWDFARDALDAGMYLSFAGNLTFPKSRELRETAKKVPAERLLVETDSPVLAPQPWRGRRNEPAHVVAVAKVLAEIRSQPIDRLSAQISANAAELFGWRNS